MNTNDNKHIFVFASFIEIRFRLFPAKLDE